MFYLYMLTIENKEEREAIRTLYEDNRAFFLNIAMKITKDKSAAEEIVQDAFIKIILHKDKVFGRLLEI